MASLSSAGIGSGLDVNSLVTQLVAAERAPADQRLAKAEATVKAQISAFGAIRSALAGLDSALKKFDGTGADLGRKVAVGADAGFSASAGSEAALGSYRITVERLATAHKLQSAPVATDAQVGFGTLTLQVGDGEPVQVQIAEGKGSLAAIRDAINAQAGGKGVSATVVRGDDGDVLVLASTRPGSDGALTIGTTGGDGGLAALTTAALTETVPAADAQVTVDGITRTVSGNSVNDAITGITLNLSKAKPGESFTLDITADASPLKASVLTLISSYNTALTALRTQSAAGGEGKTAGALSGDAAPRGMVQALRGQIGAGFGDLSALGLKTAVDGSLSMDGAKFDTAIAADPAAVARLFGSEGSVGKAMRNTLADYTRTDGLLAGRTTSLNDRVKQLAQQREAVDTRMASVEAAYRRQFTALDKIIAQMQNTSSYLTQHLAQLGNRK